MSCAASARLAVSFTPLTPEDNSVYGVIVRKREGGMISKGDDMVEWRRVEESGEE